jgi:hypothetical protein
MLIAVLDQQQYAGLEGITLAFDLSHTGARNDEEPLIGSAMTVGGAAFRAARLNHHFRRLAATVSQSDAKAFSEPKRFAFHERALT